MGPELWVGVAAVLVAGGAIGSAGTLLTQWILRKVDLAPGSGQLGTPEYRAMRKQVTELGRQMRNVEEVVVMAGLGLLPVQFHLLHLRRFLTLTSTCLIVEVLQVTIWKFLDMIHGILLLLQRMC